MMYDPFLRQENRRAENNVKSQIRTKIQREGRKLVHAWQTRERSNEHSEEFLLGQLSGYLEVRNALMPEVGSDGYVNQIKGILYQARQQKKAIDDN